MFFMSILNSLHLKIILILKLDNRRKSIKQNNDNQSKKYTTL